MPKKRQMKKTKKMRRIRRIIKSRKKNIKRKSKVSKKQRNSIGGGNPQKKKSPKFQFADKGLFVSMGSRGTLKKTKKPAPNNEIKNSVSKALLQVKGNKLTDSEFGGLLEVGMGDENSKGETLVGYCDQPGYNKSKPKLVKQKPKDEHGFFFILEPMKDSRSGDLGGYPYNFYDGDKKKELRGQKVKDLSPFLYVNPDVRPNCIPTPKKKKPVTLAKVVEKAKNTVSKASNIVKKATTQKTPAESELNKGIKEVDKSSKELNKAQKKSEKAEIEKSNAEDKLIEAIDRGNEEAIKDAQDKLAEVEKKEQERKTQEEEAKIKLEKEESKIENLEENLKLEKEGTPASRLQKACVKYNKNKDLSKECDKKCKTDETPWNKCIGDVIFKPDGSFEVENERCGENVAEVLLHTQQVSEKKNIGEFETCIKNRKYNDRCQEGLECTTVPIGCGVSEERQICMKKK